MKKLALIAAALAFAATTTTTFAAEVNWDKATVSFVRGSIDGSPDLQELDLDKPNGADLQISKAVGGLLLQGSFTSVGSDSSFSNPQTRLNTEMNLDHLSLGAGFVKKMSPTTDIYGLFSYEKLSLDVNLDIDIAINNDFVQQQIRLEEKENGYGVTFGVKSMVTDRIELTAALRHINLDGSDTGGLVGANVFVTEKFAFGLAYEDIGDFSNLKASVSYAF